MSETEQIKLALRLLAERCPRLIRLCYWAGTSAVAIEELHHRKSFDLDFHTLRAHQDVRPILEEIHSSFPEDLELLQAPDEFGSAFRALLRLPAGSKIPIEVLSNYQDVPLSELVPSRTVPSIKRVALHRYLADKIQCVADRAEARDLIDIGAVLQRHPEMESLARQFLREQDAVLIAERLLGWSDDAVAEDLTSYPDVNPEDGKRVRQQLLNWLREEEK